ncbi:hypothetical protein BO71DRAFT_250294 [Aspergillus ellipticus CBS 707.79]|uniref:Uncharacterized protein n=1 Tax=Aspergillus ellipticus CBS 707.79 TaxID=1448320 RepID=A0A319ERX1_9EURO|nr:hypothetical protein BO71DRAFT_250294 [Aspergillus ellipticus CBS 707.79]
MDCLQYNDSRTIYHYISYSTVILIISSIHWCCQSIIDGIKSQFINPWLDFYGGCHLDNPSRYIFSPGK